MTKKIDQMTPEQIRDRGRELLRLAQQKEKEVKQRQLVRLGEIFQREILNSWATPWPTLQAEVETLLGCQIAFPAWGGQGGNAPLVEVKNESK